MFWWVSLVKKCASRAYNLPRALHHNIWSLLSHHTAAFWHAFPLLGVILQTSRFSFTEAIYDDWEFVAVPIANTADSRTSIVWSNLSQHDGPVDPQSWSQSAELLRCCNSTAAKCYPGLFSSPLFSPHSDGLWELLKRWQRTPLLTQLARCENREGGDKSPTSALVFLQSDERQHE